jgi:hypothetical protein
MTKNIAFKDVNQGTALGTGTLPLAPLVIEGLEDFKGELRSAVPAGWDRGDRGDAGGRCRTPALHRAYRQH